MFSGKGTDRILLLPQPSSPGMSVCLSVRVCVSVCLTKFSQMTKCGIWNLEFRIMFIITFSAI